MTRDCDTCIHSLGGHYCRLGVEAECGDGGHECWEPGTLEALLDGVCVEV